MHLMQAIWLWGADPISGMLASFKRPTTGRWIFWPPFSFCCTRLEWMVMGKTGSSGLLLIKENLMLDLSTRSLLAKRIFIFPGKVYGGPMFP